MEKLKQPKKEGILNNNKLDKKIIPYVKILISLIILQIVISVFNTDFSDINLDTGVFILGVISIIVQTFKD